MKQFSEQERRIIISIFRAKDSNNYVLTNVFAPLLEVVGFNLANGSLALDSSQIHDADAMLNIQKEVINTALLIKYLEDEGYIYIIEDNTSVSPLNYVGPKFSMPVVVALPKDIAQIVSRSTYRVYVSYSLIQLVENNFSTYEEQQLLLAQEQLDTATGSLHQAHEQSKSARKTLCWSIVTCIIAILTLLSTIFVPSCSRCKTTERIGSNSESNNNATEIDATAINTRLDLINNNILQLVEFSANLNNNFKIQPKIHLNPRKKSSSPKEVEQTQKKCSSVQPILKIDTINCDGETYWVLPCPPKKTSMIEEKEK